MIKSHLTPPVDIEPAIDWTISNILIHREWGIVVINVPALNDVHERRKGIILNNENSPEYTIGHTISLDGTYYSLFNGEITLSNNK